MKLLGGLRTNGRMRQWHSGGLGRDDAREATREGEDASRTCSGVVRLLSAPDSQGVCVDSGQPVRR